MSRLDKTVLEAIEKRGLSPRPAVYFLARRSIFWTLAGVSIILGAISVAVTIFAATDFVATGGHNFDEMPFDDLLMSLPVLWLGVFGLLIVSSFLAFSHTKRGHRYHPLSVVAIAMTISIALGLVLHAFDAGRAVHAFLSAQIPAYRVFTHIPYAEWSRPDQGYLGGEVLFEAPGKSLRLRDFSGHTWVVDTSTATTTLSGSLVEEGDVAIRGTRTGPSAFKAESIDEFD